MRARVSAALSFVLLFPAFAAAQSDKPQNGQSAWTARPKFEITASVAMGHIFRFDDQAFGNRLNFGVGVEVPVWRKLRLGAEINKTFGLTPNPVSCGGILSGPDQPLPCVGTAREGMSEALAGSLTAAYYFGEGRIQPYLLGGISFLGAKEHSSASIVRQDFVELSESSLKSTGIGPALGAGLRVSINRRFSIRPEVRFYDGTLLSSINLSQWRISIGAAYGW